jgi:di/tricarboxylate transporter
MPTLAIAIFVAVFAIATFRNIHLGVLMIPAACAVGVWLAGMSLRDVITGYPINILILIAGVTYFFGIAQGNGTIDRLIQKVLAAVGARRSLLPYVFYVITAGVASMGSSQAGYVMIPLAMPAARRSGVNPMVMAVALNSGMSTGGFAPTSLFGIVTASTARQAGIDLNPLALLAAALVANLALLVAATWLFPGPNLTTTRRDDEIEPLPTGANERFGLHQIVTLVCIVSLILAVIVGFSLGFTPDIGVIAFGFGAALALLYPKVGAEAVRRIDWSTAFMVGGIVTFVGVLQRLDAVNLLGHAAMNVGTPLVAAFVICMIAGLVSAFASTAGILAALVPMAVPLATSGGVPGWALLSALGVCASIVDASPFSTTGALIVATVPEDERQRLKSLLTRWGLSMVIVGPAAAVLALLLLGRS